jgi:hypothetical protein
MQFRLDLVYFSKMWSLWSHRTLGYPWGLTNKNPYPLTNKKKNFPSCVIVGLVMKN